MTSDAAHASNLPGIGRRLDLTDDEDRPVTIIRHKDATLEIHLTDGTTTVLPPDQARALGSLASGHFSMSPGLISRTAEVLGGIEFDWVRIPRGSWVAGLTIDQVAVRRRTGTTIVAILRGSLPIVDPGPGQTLEADDELVIVCGPGERAAFERFLVEGS